MIGVEQGDTLLFSDFEDGGDMWTGKGPREARVAVNFSQPFRTQPVISVSLSMFDMDQNANQRADIGAENVSREGFEIVFRTWGDTRIARARAAWSAMGELTDEDQWDV